MRIFAGLIALAVVFYLFYGSSNKNLGVVFAASDGSSEMLAENITRGAPISLDIDFLETFDLGLPKPTKMMPDRSMPAEMYIHPVCLEVFKEDAPEDVFECTENDFSDVEITHSDDSTRLLTEIVNDWGGYIGYRLFNQQFKNGHQYLLLTMFWNGGGTGVFSQNLILAKAIGTNSYITILRTIHGDRCNDGYVGDLLLEGLEVRWSEAATPFRLLNVIDETDWRMARLLRQFIESDENTLPALFNNLEPYDDIENAAISCAGRVYRTINLVTMEKNVTGVWIDLNAWQEQSQGSQAECLKAWADHFFSDREQDNIFLSLAEWQHALRDLELICKK